MSQCVLVDGAMTDQSAALEWRAGQVPVSTRFDDPYFSLDDGPAETAHVFLDGNGLSSRFDAPLSMQRDHVNAHRRKRGGRISAPSIH